MSTQRQFQGYNQSDFINKTDEISGIRFYKLAKSNKEFKKHLPTGLRLGNRVEHFVFQQLEEEGFDVLLKNFQVISDKLTIGEIDCIATNEKSNYHFEIVYKFYLYDATVGETELDHWIGPNRKDSLVEKLNKLKSKQLPLLHHAITCQQLENLQLDTKKIQQSVIFKAQLFIPYNTQHLPSGLINEKCIVGFYISINDLSQLENTKFFIPEKLDWLQACHHDVKWLNLEQFQKEVKLPCDAQRSPLCWTKDRDGKMKKIFVVWW